jgi:hypothetical protein
MTIIGDEWGTFNLCKRKLIEHRNIECIGMVMMVISGRKRRMWLLRNGQRSFSRSLSCFANKRYISVTINLRLLDAWFSNTQHPYYNVI